MCENMVVGPEPSVAIDGVLLSIHAFTSFSNDNISLVDNVSNVADSRVVDLSKLI